MDNVVHAVCCFDSEPAHNARPPKSKICHNPNNLCVLQLNKANT